MRNGKEKAGFFAFYGFQHVNGKAAVACFSCFSAGFRGVCAHNGLIYVKKNTNLGEKSMRNDCRMKNSSYLCIVERKKERKQIKNCNVISK